VFLSQPHETIKEVPDGFSVLGFLIAKVGIVTGQNGGKKQKT